MISSKDTDELDATLHSILVIFQFALAVGVAVSAFAFTFHSGYIPIA